MIKDTYKVIGVMSGTSLDGLDLAYVQFKLDGTWTFEILVAETIAYDATWYTTLKNLVTTSAKELKVIDVQYTQLLSEAITTFINKNDISDVDAVCSHGHTALHDPENGMTYQIGNLEALASLIQTTLVCDFRVQDVALGGQGAPLVPIGDRLLFSEYTYCINLGGFANISTELNGNRIAYDICPVNIVLNHYVSILGLAYDNGGNIAASGVINDDLLQTLNGLDYYGKPYPKSLGLEWVQSEILPRIDTYNLEVKDILRTFVEHVAIQITNNLDKTGESKVLLTGGGVYHGFLMARIRELTSSLLVVPSEDIIDYKEAVIFGFLGVLKLRGDINCLSAVTGAKHDHSSGKIYLP